MCYIVFTFKQRTINCQTISTETFFPVIWYPCYKGIDILFMQHQTVSLKNKNQTNNKNLCKPHIIKHKDKPTLWCALADVNLTADTPKICLNFLLVQIEVFDIYFLSFSRMGNIIVAIIYGDVIVCVTCFWRYERKQIFRGVITAHRYKSGLWHLKSLFLL